VDVGPELLGGAEGQKVSNQLPLEQLIPPLGPRTPGTQDGAVEEHQPQPIELIQLPQVLTCWQSQSFGDFAHNLQVDDGVVGPDVEPPVQYEPHHPHIDDTHPLHVGEEQFCPLNEVKSNGKNRKTKQCIGYGIK